MADSQPPACSTPAPANPLPVGREDHSPPFSDDAHDGVPQHAACLRVHACGGLILWGGRGQGPGLLHPPWSASSEHYLWQTMHKSLPSGVRLRVPGHRVYKAGGRLGE